MMGTYVMASVQGPAQATQRAEKMDTCAVEVVWEQPAGHSRDDAHVKHLELVVRRCVEGALLGSLLPRRAIRVAVQVVSDAGSVLSAAVNAASLALLHLSLIHI